MLYKIYEALKADSLIQDKVGSRIKFYEYPETGNMKETYIIIDPLDTPKPSDYADDKWLTEDYLYQIEVWSKSLTDRDAVAKQIQILMWKEFHFRDTGGGVDEWDKDLNIYRDARRYRGKQYNF